MSLTSEQGRQACERIMKFTPGPWTTKWNRHEPSDDNPNPSNLHSIDIVSENWQDQDSFGEAWIGDVNMQFLGKENGWANAKLIATCPDMFDLICRIVDHPEVSQWSEEAKMIINKATK